MSHAEEDERLRQLATRGATNFAATSDLELSVILIKKLRALTDTVVAQQEATSRLQEANNVLQRTAVILTSRIGRMTLWLLIFTTVIGILTLVQLLAALKVVGR